MSGLFDIINNISNKKGLLEYEDVSENYVPFITNRFFGQHLDTIFLANEANTKLAKVPYYQQYLFYYGAVRKRYRKGNWSRNKIKEVEAIEDIKELLGYSDKKALEVLPLILPVYDELKLIRGGRDDTKGKRTRKSSD